MSGKAPRTFHASTHTDPAHCMWFGAEMANQDLTGGATPASLAVSIPMPSYNIAFNNDNGIIGKLDFNGPALVFTGNAEESAKVFIDWVATAFHGRLAEERAAAQREIDALTAKLDRLSKLATPAEATLEENVWLRGRLGVAVAAVRSVNQDRGWDDLSDAAQELVASVLAKEGRQQ